MRVFVDVNVFMDVQRKRAGWKQSFAVIKSVVEGRNEGYVSALTPVIIYFLRRRVRDEESARRETSDLIKGFKVVSLTEEILSNSFKEERIDDFEDAIQFHSAKGCDVFVTRNKRDYEGVRDQIEILTPEEFIERHGL